MQEKVYPRKSSFSSALKFPASNLLFIKETPHWTYFALQFDLNLFTDIDECSIVPSICDLNADCQNNNGSYLCSCQLGFIGDGKTCRGNMGK